MRQLSVFRVPTGIEPQPVVPARHDDVMYAVDPPGLRTLCAYLLLREKIIKPLLAGVVRPRGRPPKVVAPLDQHYVALRDELQRTFQTIGLAAA
jgi:hypothetical protein